MIDYKTLRQDKNGIPVRQMYYGIVLKGAIKEKESWTKPNLIDKVKKKCLYHQICLHLKIQKVSTL